MKLAGLKHSVTTKILMIVILCWVLPLIIIGGYSVFFYSNSINSRINDYLQNQFYYYNEFAIERINSCVEQSKKSTYDLTIENAYSKYQSNELTRNDFFNIADGYNRNRYYLNTRYLLSALFLTDEPDLISYTSRDGMPDINHYRQTIHKQVIALSKDLDTGVGFLADGDRLYLVRNMMLVSGPKKCFAVLVLQLDPGYLFAHMLPQTDTDTKAMGLSLNNTVVTIQSPRYASDNSIPYENLSETLLKTDGNTILSDRRNIYFYNRKKTDDYIFGSAMVLNKAAVYSRFQILKDVIYLIGIMMVPISIMVLYFLYKNVTKPIKVLVKATSQIKQGSFGVVIDDKALQNIEFGALAESFNSMSAELKRLFEVVYKEELALKDAKILALQAQINPHFLNNTLELMNWQARMAGDNDVSLMIEALSTLLDSSMDRSDRRLIPLYEELNCCDAYLYIIGKRFGKRINIYKEVEESLRTQMVPRLILQPLLENAVIHGVEPVQSGDVCIKIYASDDRHMVIRIVNNGKALTDQDIVHISRLLSEEASKEGVANRLGIRNVNERLKLIYGTEYGLSIYRDEEGSTISEIIIPLE